MCADPPGSKRGILRSIWARSKGQGSELSTSRSGRGCRVADYYTPSPHNKKKQATTGSKQRALSHKQRHARHTSKIFSAPALAPPPARNLGVGLTEWCPPSTLVFGSRLPPHSAPRQPQPQGLTMGQTGQKQPKTAPDRAGGSSVRVRAALWPIGGAWHAVGAFRRLFGSVVGHFGRHQAGSAPKPKNRRTSGWTV